MMNLTAKLTVAHCCCAGLAGHGNCHSCHAEAAETVVAPADEGAACLAA